VLKFTSILTVLIWAAVLFFFASALLDGSAFHFHQAPSVIFVALFASSAIFLACLAAIRRSAAASRWLIGLSVPASIWSAACAWSVVSPTFSGARIMLGGWLFLTGLLIIFITPFLWMVALRTLQRPNQAMKRIATD
jgi:hypothetical protein